MRSDYRHSAVGPELCYFLEGYFHQDMDLEGGNPGEIVRTNCGGEPRAKQLALTIEMQALLDGPELFDLGGAMQEMTDFVVLGGDYSPREFLCLSSEHYKRASRVTPSADRAQASRDRRVFAKDQRAQRGALERAARPRWGRK